MKTETTQTLTPMLLLNAAFCLEKPSEVPDDKRNAIMEKLLAAAKELKEATESAQPAAKDECYEKAKQIVLACAHPCISKIQRTLAIGYNRAARIMDALIENCVIEKYTTVNGVAYKVAAFTTPSSASQDAPPFDEAEFQQMVEKGTAAWKDVPENWLEQLRGNPHPSLECQKMAEHLKNEPFIAAYIQELESQNKKLKDAATQQDALQPTVEVKRDRIWIVKGNQSFLLAYEADTEEELNWYANQLRKVLSPAFLEATITCTIPTTTQEKK